MTDDNSSKESMKKKVAKIMIVISLSVVTGYLIAHFYIEFSSFDLTREGSITVPENVIIKHESNNYADKSRTGPGTLDSIGSLVNPYTGKCIWGSNGNTCISAGEWLDWCMSFPKGNVTSNMLDFCTYLMTGNDRVPLKPLPFTQTWNETGHYYLINETFVQSKIVESIEKELS